MQVSWEAMQFTGDATNVVSSPFFYVRRDKNEAIGQT